MKAADLQQWLATLNPDAEVHLKIWRDGDYDEVEIEAVEACPQPMIVGYLEDNG